MNQEKAVYDYILKIVIIGSSGVGKTSVLSRYTDDRMNETHLTTIGIDFKIKTLNVNGRSVKLQLWDTAGQERFESLVENYFRGAKGVVYVFSLTDNRSFEAIPRFISRTEGHMIPCAILLGNKADLTAERKVTPAQIHDMCNMYDNMTYVETSAKTGQNVADAFAQLAHSLVQTLDESKIRCTEGSVENRDVFTLQGTNPFEEPEQEIPVKKCSC